MTWKQVFTSSIGQKITMALTGIFLILFLIVHVGVNALVWAGDHGEMFNRAANFLGANVVPRILEIGLFLFIILHIVQGLVLEAENRSKRGIGYAVDYGNRGSRWYSRSMGLLGTLILLFLIIHLIDFWVPSRFGRMPEASINNGTKEVHDLYSLMYYRFQTLWIVVVYVLGCISLAYHLLHGFYSSFKTMGVYNKRYLVIIRWCGYIFSIVVSLAFAMMPVSFYLGWLSAPVN
ncbi:succinate dehydrogenase cytochrome b subunit [Parafilimonas terrae]|uniref:Succinate dehydrogenase / fumarate reductase cytochrome b subunit n=1 Tax=Parafilimonas terrae TaxID=1465490 RepID=A0A1I5SEY5_9BACT|nr:succinate dehydrogenase cytochrome b subunit [Parafilimonas terrae]SFP69281.1 succinate dehydrogenase / fumarate reductase cytochrome b subunit [Parafilimonas terrae]